jgi:hypothetical protein
VDGAGELSTWPPELVVDDEVADQAARLLAERV